MNHLDCDQTKFDYQLSCSSVYRVNQNKLITILKVIDFAEVGKYCGSYCRRSKLSDFYSICHFAIQCFIDIVNLTPTRVLNLFLNRSLRRVLSFNLL